MSADWRPRSGSDCEYKGYCLLVSQVDSPPAMYVWSASLVGDFATVTVEYPMFYCCVEDAEQAAVDWVDSQVPKP